MDVKRRKQITKFIFIIFLIHLTNSVDICNITGKVFEDNWIKGVLAAFGDFNSDKLIDLFFILENGLSIGVYVATENEPLFSKNAANSCKINDGLTVTSIVPGDFNGDSKMDILLTLKSISNEGNGPITVKILDGNQTMEKLCQDTVKVTIRNMSVEPTVLDYNGDMIPDLYGETIDGKRTVWLMKQNWTMQVETIKTDNRIRQIQSNAFVNLNDDKAADVFVTTANKSFEVWQNKDGSYHNPSLTSFPEGAAVIGQSAFLDIDLDGHLDHIVPVCFDASCLNATIFVRKNANSDSSKWLPVIGKFMPDDSKEWGFYQTESYPITLHIGDYNLDGYPDLLTIIYHNDTMREAVILENMACQDSAICPFERLFKVTMRLFKSVENVILAAFYDIFQDGNLDFLLVSNNSLKGLSMTAFENKVDSDVCFLKILVLSGLENPKNVNAAYGVNQPGPFITYKTTKVDGDPQKSCAAQLSQSAHFALQLPYTLFGLGQTPNFVDELTVGIPRSRKLTEKDSEKTWKTIIPNSQMIIIPLRNDDGQTIKWSSLLFVKPFSHQVIIALIALVGTCVLIILIIGGLHWKEKIADKKEKLQEAHKFHFDAM